MFYLKECKDSIFITIIKIVSIYYQDRLSGVLFVILKHDLTKTKNGKTFITERNKGFWPWPDA